MDGNLRIVKSIKKLNENITSAENEQKKIQEKTNLLEVKQKEIKRDIENKINKQEERLLKQNETLEKELTEKIKNISLTPGEKGKDGKDGQDGKNGRDGIDGRDGKDGLNGKDGKDGKDGRDGVNGINGINGKDGIGIASAKVDKNGDLIITLTDGKKINSGHVKGQNGLNGANGMGVPGVSVENVQIEDNHLIVTLSNGDKIDAGYIGGGGSGTTNYNDLDNKPSINNITLINNKTSDDLGLQDKINEITNQEIDLIIYGG